jgi:hypothetical protein
VMLIGNVNEAHTFEEVVGWKTFRKLISLVDVAQSDATVESDKGMILERVR